MVTVSFADITRLRDAKCVLAIFSGKGTGGIDMRDIVLGGIGGAVAAAAAFGMMTMKSDSYKRRFGCKSCRYENRLMLSKPCSVCHARHGSRWKVKKETCDCCGQEVE